METGNITFKGTKEALIIMLSEKPTTEEIISELEKKLETSVNFLKGVNYPIKVRGRKFTKDEFALIAKKIKEIVGLEVSEEDDKEFEFKAKKAAGVEVKGVFHGIDEGMTKFHRGTLRSGQLLKFHGNIVVIGDANPGSEIVASGNIIVLGTLRGIVHAGVTGNKGSVVVAFNLQPTQLRIADVITRPPDEMIVKSPMPEIAFIKNDIIYLEYYLPNR